MNTREYISSGIVESYVLGLPVDIMEKEKFEQLCLTCPEIRAVKDAFELSLEEYALANSIQPPDHVRKRLFRNGRHAS